MYVSRPATPPAPILAAAMGALLALAAPPAGAGPASDGAESSPPASREAAEPAGEERPGLPEEASFPPAGAPGEEEQPSSQAPPEPAGDAGASPEAPPPLLRPGMQFAYKFEPVFLEDEQVPRSSFLVLRGTLAGSVYRPWIRYWASVEVAANPPHALDAYVEVQPWPELGVRVGQQYIAYSRHESLGLASLLFPDWSAVANYFYPGWDKGVAVFGKPFDGRLEFYAGVYAASPLRQFRSVPGNYLVAARLAASPRGPLGPTEMPWAFLDQVPFRWSFSLQGYTGRSRPAEENFNPTSGLFEITVPPGGRSLRTTAGADFALQVDRLSFLAETYLRRTDPTGEGATFTSRGTWMQVGLGVARRASLGLRFGHLDPDVDVGDDGLLSMEASGSWYVDPGRIHLQLRYGFADQASPGPGDEAPAAPLPLAPGVSQSFTVQLGVFF